MQWWIPVVPAVLVITMIFTTLLLLFLRFLNNHHHQKPSEIPETTPKINHVSITTRALPDRDHLRYHVFRRGLSSKPLFNWSDNPSLVTDAVENGWSRFAFTTYASSSVSVRSKSFLGPCAAVDDGGDSDTTFQISWEVCQGSADFLQRIRLNSGFKKVAATASSMSAASVIKSALPLPGPVLGNPSPFPQEAYFEITIFSSDFDDDVVEGEKIKLIKESPSEKVKSESLVHVTSKGLNFVGGGNGKYEELRGRSQKYGGEEVMLSVGMSGGGPPPLRLPGSYPGSVGFNSNGSVYLDGVKVLFESEKEDWGRTDKVIGCGYNPGQKKVFLTVDAELVHEIHCKSEEFGSPLYPTLAANCDITFLVNFGQCAFKYAPANLQRTPNPCFIGPLGTSPILGYDDSRELFSMGRIDSQWLNRNSTRSIQHSSSNYKPAADFDEVSEGDLFEIVLDSVGRSPITPS